MFDRLAHRLLITALVLAAVAPAVARAADSFTAHADLRPTGCTQDLTAGVVRIEGCTARGRAGGTVPGKIRVEYSARVELARGSGVQQGTLTLASASGNDVLVARFHGTLSISTGVSRGGWTAARRQGLFAKLPVHGSYVSSSPDRGIHVSFDVHG
jgi:hypothetical protein